MERLSSYLTGTDLVANGGGFYRVANPPAAILGVAPFAVLAHIRAPNAWDQATPQSCIVASCSDFTAQQGWALTWDRATDTFDMLDGTSTHQYQLTSARGRSSLGYSDYLIGLYVASAGGPADYLVANNLDVSGGGTTFAQAAAPLCIGGTDDAGLIGNYATPVGLQGGCGLSALAVMATNVGTDSSTFAPQLASLWQGLLERGSIPADHPNLTHLFTARKGIPGLIDDDDLDWVDEIGGVTAVRFGTQTGATVGAYQPRFLPTDV